MGWGPSNDRQDTADLLAKASTVNQPERLYADAGCDSDEVHRFCREALHVETYMSGLKQTTGGGVTARHEHSLFT